MTDNRFPTPGTDARFPSPGTDVRFADAGIDGRFLDGVDTRFEGDTYGGAQIITATVDPAADAMFDGETVGDITNFATLDSTGNYASSEGTIASVQWLVDGVDQAGSYELSVGEAIVLRVTDSAANTRDWTIDASVAAVVPSISGVPTIAGTEEEDQTLTATAASVTGSPTPTRTWQWERSGVAISGATSSTYTLTADDVGETLTVVQTETNAGGSDTAESAATGVIAEASAFDPATLFSSGEEGVWYDIAPAYLFQNSDGTGAVSVGDPVGYITDRSGNGNHATQATSAQRPVLRQDGSGNYYLEFDGVDDQFRVTYAGTVTDKTLAISYLQNNGGDMPIDDVNNPNGSSIYISGTTCRWMTSGDLITGSGGGWAASGSEQYAIGVALSDGSHVLTGSGNSASGTGTAPANMNGLTIGMAAGSTQKLDGNIYSIVDIDRELTSGEKANLTTFVAGKAGITA